MTKVSLSFVSALIVTALFVAAGVAIIALGRRALRHNDWHNRNAGGYHNASSDFWLDGGMAVVGGWVTVVVTLGVAALGLFPYDMEYHRFKYVEGTVQEVEGRFLSAGRGTSENFAVKLTDGGTYRCDDTRCSLLKPGDSVSLWCIREWEYAANSGWACRFDGSTAR